MMFCRETFLSKTSESWQVLKPVWNDAVGKTVHETDVFGPLRVHMTAPGIARIRYMDRSIDAELATGLAMPSADTTASSEIPAFYMAERLVMPFIRMFRGALLLHASALCLDDICVAFLAPPGIGKSTLAAACLAHLHASLIADDTLAVAPDFSAFPGSAHIAMRHGAFDSADFVDNISPLGFKKILRCRHQYIETKCRTLTHLLWLEKGDRPCIIPCSPSTLTAGLLRSQFVLTNPPSGFRRFQFHQMMRLLGAVPVCRCIFNPDRLDEWIELMLQTLNPP